MIKKFNMRLTCKSILSFIALIITFYDEPVFSQAVHFNYDYDSLANQLPLQKTDEEKIKLLCLLVVDGSPEFSREPPDRLVNYLGQLIELNKKTPAIDIQPYVKMQESYVQWRNGDFDNALSNLKLAIDLFDGQKKVITPLLTEIRTLYNRMNNQEGRFEFYKKKLEYYLLNGPVENTAACYHGIAGYYNYKADYNLAISNYLRAATIFKNFWQYFYRNELGVVGVTYKRWGNDEKAEYYLNLALPLMEANRDSGNIVFCLGGLIDISIKQKKYDQAISYADKCLGFVHKNANDPNYAIALMQKTFVFLAMEKPDLAYPYLLEVQALIDKFHFQLSGNDGDLECDFGFYTYYRLINDRKTAATYLNSAYKKAVTEEDVLFTLKYLKELASFNEKEEPELSMQYIHKYFELQDALEKSNQKFKVAQYEIDRKEMEQTQSINALQQERAIQEAMLSQRNTILWISLVALFLIAVSMIFLYIQFHNNRKTLRSLRKTQRQLIISEKMASLGELTAGIAHEIQNPLNFVNNFSEVSVDLIEEMASEIDLGNTDEVKAIAGDLKQNLGKITYHGKRASGIVKAMLEHSRASTGQKEPTDINVLADEYLRLSYHGLRAKDKSFNADFKTDFDETLPKINIVAQDIGRVMLNLVNNAFYAVSVRNQSGFSNLTGLEYKPQVIVSTKKFGDQLEIRVKDNGNGIPANVLEKIFQPFFTTKPTGEGTGLGLSLSYDIVKAHGGELKVETKEGEGTEFIIHLPL
jgi:two-component system, NtrC family, sensor kinase